MKKFILGLVLAALVSGVDQPVAFSDSNATMNIKQFNLNRFNPSAFSRYQVGTELIKTTKRSKKCVWDFAVSGGAISTINLKDELGANCALPSGSLITSVYLDVITAPVMAPSGTLAFSSGASAGDFKATTAYASYTGIVAGVPVGTAATAIKLTADKSPTVVIATSAATAGKINVIIDYSVSE